MLRILLIDDIYFLSFSLFVLSASFQKIVFIIFMCQVDNHYANCAYFLDTQDQLLI